MQVIPRRLEGFGFTASKRIEVARNNPLTFKTDLLCFLLKVLRRRGVTGQENP
jgi:Fe2+ transport system protein FeoA